MASKKLYDYRIINKLENKIGIKIKNKDLFYEALTHKSYLYINPYHPFKDNERLEFLGDAIIEFSISKYLFENLPEYSEGFLTLLRSSLVNREKLFIAAENIGLMNFMFYNKNLDEKGIKTILSDGFEALTAAIFLDNDFETANNFIVDNLTKDLNHIIENKLYKDPKSKLQEYLQFKYKKLPKYNVIRTEGPEHQKKFIVGLFLDDELITVGEGENKQSAELNAAIKALKKFKI
jgi:ribonuclease-3